MSNAWEFDMYAGECPVKIYKLTELSQVNKHLTDILEAPSGIPLLLSEQVFKKGEGIGPIFDSEIEWWFLDTMK